MSDETHSPRMSPAGEKPKPGPKRIYEVADAVEVNEGYAIQLDGRSVRTPARHLLVVPTQGLADAVVGEWMAQGEHVDHNAMPMTRFANTAIDNVRGREDAIIDEIAAFAGNDLLCYRGDTPDSLVAAQSQAWDPVLDWAKATFGAQFVLTAGVIHVPQDEATLEAMRTAIAMFDPFGLTGLHNMTTLSGSAILALATARGFLEHDDAWTRAHVDEDWQISRWGDDAEAQERRIYRGGEYQSASQFLSLATPV